MAQNEGIEGDKRIARRRFQLDPTLALQRVFDHIVWGNEGKDARYLSKPRRPLAKSKEGDRRKLLLYKAQKIAEVSSNGGKQLIPPDGV